MSKDKRNNSLIGLLGIGLLGYGAYKICETISNEHKKIKKWLKNPSIEVNFMNSSRIDN